MRIIICVISLLVTCAMAAQEKKSIEALSIFKPLLIDGILDEPVYSASKPAADFVQLQPYNGKPAYQSSEVYIFYDQTAIYVGANLYDSSPDSIFNFITERDNTGMSDYFGVYLDPYNQGQLAYGFFLTPAGVQTDVKATKSDSDNEDFNWNAVWQSKSRMTAKGWVVEMRIPYSALRFPENGGGTWGLQMFRNIRRYNSNSSWNLIDTRQTGFIHQEGQLTGIKNLKPPIRLSLSPYAATYAESSGKSTSIDFIYKGGMDLKYGINESFTLDMMLIPDFGQIQADDKQLNLSPYELYYSEKRQYFTEGTELFNRGGISFSRGKPGAQIFYTRRIGATPKFGYKVSGELSDNEIIEYNPTETQMVNATKISGRTPGGLGLGMLNAMTLPSYARIIDTISGQKHSVQIQPFTNYNVTVIDKSLKNNSFVSFINTNMMMSGNSFLANVTATDFQIRNKTKKFAISGKGGISVRNDTNRETGFFGLLGLAKNRGKLQYGTSQLIYSDKFNPNDMGYLRRNNEMTTRSYINYNILEPFGIFREVRTGIGWDHFRMYRLNKLAGNEIYANIFGMFKNNYGAQVILRTTGNKYDYYEPRVAGRYFFEPVRYAWDFYSFSDERKALSVSLGTSGYRIPERDQSSRSGSINISLRVGKRFQLFYASEIRDETNNHGFANMTSSRDTVYFARRDIKSVESVLGTSYVINPRAGLNLRIRHYWSGVTNKSFYQLKPDGSLTGDPAFIPDNNENYNAFNVDLVYRWIFAPGSELTLAWKNSILDNRDVVTDNYWNNLRKTWYADQINSLSLKILYYIDYNNLRKKQL